jgi:hypothetical protein
MALGGAFMMNWLFFRQMACACTLALLSCFTGLHAKPEKKQALYCDTIILGGGAAGTYTAYKLSTHAKYKPGSLCLFEKEKRLGGRIYDVALDESKPDRVYGAGALRVMEGQSLVFALAKELGIELEPMPYGNDLINARGHSVLSSDELAKVAYPAFDTAINSGLQPLKSTGNALQRPAGALAGADALSTFETGLHERLLNHPIRNQRAMVFDVRSYARQVLGPSSYQFLTDITRFRGEFNRPVDARSYLEYLPQELSNCCTPYYPVGGMSQFVIRMSQRAKARGAKIFLDEPALAISKSKRSASARYLVETRRYVATARRIVVAIDAGGFQHVKGTLAEAVKAAPQFQDIFGVKVVSINQRWPNAWWKELGDIGRAWTTEHCLNFIEIPHNPYAASQFVTRSVYSDDPSCNEFWQHIKERKGKVAVEDEIMRGLKHLFPKANIPKPLNTHFQVWPNAWYWLKAGTQFTNSDVADWALEPVKGEAIALVGDSYFINRAGWTDGAYKSAERLLNNFEFHKI